MKEKRGRTHSRILLRRENRGPGSDGTARLVGLFKNLDQKFGLCCFQRCEHTGLAGSSSAKIRHPRGGETKLYESVRPSKVCAWHAAHSKLHVRLDMDTTLMHLSSIKIGSVQITCEEAPGGCRLMRGRVVISSCQPLVKDQGGVHLELRNISL